MCFTMKPWLCVLVFGLYLYVVADLLTQNANNYGPYVVVWDHFDPCRGPKMKNLTTFETRLSKLENNVYMGIVNVSFLEQAHVEEIKMTVYTIKNKVKTVLWNYNVNKPCQHYALAIVIEQAGFSNCVFKKGGNIFTTVNLTDIMMNYIGKSFFYGEYIFKVVISSKKGNVMCFMFDPNFKKIKH